MTDHTNKRAARAAFYLALIAAILGAIALPALAAPDVRPPLLTIADGPVQVLRAATRFDAAEGLALADGDIVRTAPATRVARIEFGDRRALDLGPATQVLLLSPAAAQAQGWPGASALLLQGWAKLSAGTAPSRLVLPHAVAVGDAQGTLLAQAAADGAALAFAESRGLTMLPRSAGGAELLLREGETWTRDAASGAVRVWARTAALKEMPRALADTLPRRATLFEGRVVEAADGVPLEPADLAPWTQAEPQLMATQRPALRSTALRNAVHTTARMTANTAMSTSARIAARTPLRRGTRILLAPSAATAPVAVAPLAMPPTVFLTAEPVVTVRLP
jgi:hypothetical protein